MAFQNYSECLSTFQKLKGGVKDIQKEREAFEAWLKSLNENGRTTYFLGQESTVAWEAWQAAKAQAVPEGYKVVPVNYECVWCGCTELDGWADETMIEAQEQNQ